MQTGTMLLRHGIALSFAIRVLWASPSVSKVEPPNWWPGHTLNPVRLLIRGTDLRGATVSAPGGLQAANVRANDKGSYLFVDVRIDRGLQPGSYPLRIHTAHGDTTAPFSLAAPLLPAGRFQGFSSDDVIYLIMPDRFANGDPSNDDPAISKGLFDRKNPHSYHGGDLQGVIDHLPYLKALGVTALWLTPVYDNTNEPNRQQAVGGRPISDYHGYGTVDYYGIEEHFGTFELLRRLVDQAHALGLKVIQDQVANHVGPGHPWAADPPAPDWFHGTAAHHINEAWQIWTLPDPHASAALKTSVTEGWFADVLPDMNQENNDVAQYEVQNALWWVGTAGFDGIRQDTLPYVGRRFWRDWSAALKRQYPSLRAVGEVFDGDPAIPSFFQGGAARNDGIDTGVDSVFDFPIFFNIRDVFAKGADLDTIPKTLAKDRLYAHPERLVTFLGNHDVARYMSEQGATVENLKLAWTFLFTLRGIPSLYYGDELGMTGDADPENRRDFPGGWKDDTRNAFDAGGRTADENAVFNHVQKLLAIRAATEALRRGTMTDLAVTSHAWVYARESGSAAAIIAINNGAEAADLEVPWKKNGTYKAQLGVTPDLIVSAGFGKVHLAGHSAEIYIER